MIHNILKALSFILIFTYSSVANAQFGMWARSFGGTLTETPAAMIKDNAENLYVTGAFSGTVDFDPGPGVSWLTSFGSQDVYILKLNAAGNFIWVKQFKGNSDNISTAMVLDSLNNIYITGYFTSSLIDMDPSISTFTLNSNGYAEIFVSKLDSSGNFIWAKQMGGAGGDVANGIGLDNFGNVLTTGSFNGTSDFDPGPGTFTFSSISSNAVFLSKLDNAGNFIWAKKIAGTGTAGASAMHVDKVGNCYIIGNFNGTADDFDPGPATFTMTASYSSVGFGDIFISKLNAAGNFVWAKQFTKTNYEVASSITEDLTGDIYIAGSFNGTTDFDPGPSVYNLTPPASAVGTDAFVTKLDTSGNFIWAKQISGPSFDMAKSIKIDVMNNVCLVGTFVGYTDFDASASTYTLNTIGTDAFICKLDALGNFVSANQLGVTTNTAGVSPSAMLIDAQLNIFVCGTFKGSADFDPTSATNTLTSSGTNADAFVCKLILPCTVPAPPTQIINTANSIHCNNQSNTLTATSTGIVTWHSAPGSTVTLGVGNNFVTPILAQGIYTYYAQSNSCTKNTNRTALTLTVNPYPSLTITSNDSILCAGQQAILQCNGANSFLWSTLSPAGQITVSPTVTTTYSVIGTAASGCSNTASYTQSVTVCNGIAVNNINDSHIKIFPNPGAGLFNIKGNIEGEIEIFNALGQRIYCQKIATETFVIDLGEFSDGIYFIKIKNESNEKCVKIIKQQ